MTGPFPAARPRTRDRTDITLRSLVILIAVALIVYGARHLWRTSRPAGKQRSGSAAHMVQCAHCGIYIPEHEALSHAGRFYCSQAHLDDDRDKSH